MHQGPIRLRLAGLTAALALTGLGALAPVAGAQTAAPAPAGPFDPTCNGRVSLGESRQDGTMAYHWACSEDVKGYGIVTLNRQASAFDTEPVVLSMTSDNAVPGQDFSCSGPIPGDGIACAGFAAAGNRVFGSVDLMDDPCVGKRPEVALVVSDAKGRAAGPFRLVNAKPGPATRPLEGCPPATRTQRKRRSAERGLKRLR